VPLREQEKKHTAEFEQCIQDVMSQGKDKDSAFAICTATFQNAGKQIFEGLREAEWDTAYINDLPDSAFAVIGAGGEKDDQGRTVPRTLRHLPHHNADGSLDIPHLRNALARLNQIEGASQAEAKRHLCAHAKESNIVSEFCGEQPPKEGILPVKLHLFAEAIRLDGHKVSGVAIHPKKLWHPEEGETHLFLKEELKKSAPSLGGKPFGIDHLRLLPKPNLVEKAWYDEQENGVAFEGTVDDEIAQKIKEGAFKGLSIELNWFKDGVMLEKVGGAVAPRNFDFTSVHLMSRFPPADKETYVKLWEGITLPIVPAPFDIQIDQLRQMFEERIRYLEGQINALTRSDPWTQAQAPAIIIFKEAETKIAGELTQLKNMVDQLKALKEAYVIEKMKQDATIAEKEKSLTAKESEFEVALKKIGEKLSAHGPKESEVIVGLRKKVVEAEAKAAEAEKQMKEGVDEWKRKYVALHKGITESIPPPHVWRCWTLGPKQLIAEQMRILGIAPDDRW
jgi:hypothetical protein